MNLVPARRYGGRAVKSGSGTIKSVPSMLEIATFSIGNFTGGADSRHRGAHLSYYQTM